MAPEEDMSIYEKLYGFQKNIIDQFKHRYAFGLFTDMGTGKTPMSLALAEVNHCERIIVITLNAKACETVNNEGSWQQWATLYEPALQVYDKHTNAFEDKPSMLIINYESLFERGKNKTQRVTLKQVIVEYLKTCKDKLAALIIDESHKVKNLQSQQTCAITKIQRELQRISKSHKTYLLTGTPFTTGYIDLYSQLKLLGCELTKGQFIDEFCIRGSVPGLLGWQQPIVGYRNVNTLYNLIHRYAITTKADKVLKLPPQIFTTHVTSASKDFRAYTLERMPLKDIADIADSHKLDYDDVMIESESLRKRLFMATDKDLKKLYNNPFYRNIDYPDSNWLAETSGQCWLRARQLSIGFNGNITSAKWYDDRRLQQLKHFLLTHEDNYVLFYNYTAELLRLFDICSELDYKIDVYCGEVKSLFWYEKYCELTESEKLVEKKRIILANFSSGSTGMNWQAYNHCIIFSCPVFRDYAQGIKRIHRSGQTKTTFYHVFYQDNWLDKGMNDALANAKEYDAKMFESDSERINSLMAATSRGEA